MIEFLLAVIAIGVLLLSQEGKALLNAAIRIVTFLFFGGLILAIIGGIIWIIYAGLSDKTAPKWMQITATIAIFTIGLSIYGIATAWWTGIWNKTKEKYPILKTIVERTGSGLDYFYMIFMNLVFSVTIGGFSGIIVAVILAKVGASQMFGIPVSIICGIAVICISMRYFLKTHVKKKVPLQ